MRILSAFICCVPFIVSAADDSLVDLMLSHPKFKATNLGNIIPGRYIVEFEDHFQGSSLEFVEDIDLTPIKPIIRLDIAHEYGSSLFRGISVSLNKVTDRLEKRQSLDDTESLVLKQILKHHRVKRVFPVTEIERPKVTRNDFDDFFGDRSKPSITTPTIDLKSNMPNLPFSHSLSQIDKVQNELNLKGKGIVIGIIDSGKMSFFIDPFIIFLISLFIRRRLSP